eukprot:TRINITY_DN8389_c0_g1_i2.p1 TRINITY_DN8389_c0_g1~~TRINITY_DN8389_c0_g1_i2.p1  ORF type:complete len:745 (+),score=310.10 TRINITY_DN8389_c0_g1_i2:161-2236(+)
MPAAAGQDAAKKKGLPTTIQGKNGRRYRLGATLGKGGFGIVKLATEETSGEMYAAKVIDMKIVARDELLEYVDREVDLASKLNHPHIIRQIEAIELKERHLRFYIMELAPNGELFDQIVAVSRFQESTARRYYQQLIAALLFCHCQGVVHRDLKAENLLLSKDNMLKVCDFGLSRFTGESAFRDHPLLFTSIAGSLDYQAPEIVKNQKYHGRPADVWSCGVILGFMLSGWLPFQDGEGDAATKRRIMRSPPDYRLHEDVSPEARDLISHLLVADPNKRYTADDIIRHPWFLEGLDQAVCEKLLLPPYESLLEGSRADPSSPRRSAAAHSSPLHPALPLPGFDGPAGLEAIDKSQLRQLQVVFDSIDVDRSGSIQPHELRDALIKLNKQVPSQKELDSLLSFFDTAKNGEISFEEFVLGYAENKFETSCPMADRLQLKDLLTQLRSNLGFDFANFELDYVQKLRAAFSLIDEDKSGVLHRDELVHLFERANIEDVTADDIGALFEHMDRGGEDFITFEEFAAAWTAQETAEHKQRRQHENEKSSKIKRMMSRIKKCSELIQLSEAEDARRILFQARLGHMVKGSVAEVVALAQDIVASLRGMQCSIEKEALDEGEAAQSEALRIRVLEDKVECTVLVIPSVTGYCEVLTRRLTGGTAGFHKMYKQFFATLEERQEYMAALDDLAEDGDPVAM